MVLLKSLFTKRTDELFLRSTVAPVTVATPVKSLNLSV